MKSIFLGIDVGSTFCKAAILDENKKLIGNHILRSGTSFEKASEIAVEASLKMADCTLKDVAYCVSTGYGRENVKFSKRTVSEISCHSKTAFEKYKKKLTLIDIGGQDSKVVFIDDMGRRLDFVMNRKCAAGTGSFIEEMSMRLGVHISDMDKLAREADKLVKLGSFCTVFAGTEILSKIRTGINVNNLAKGIFYAVLKRVISMTTIDGMIVLTGGVAAHNPYIAEMMETMTGCRVLQPTYPQLFGAIGAALYAKNFKKEQ
ncbi:MAG TPA: acyl-CoA dehydratase activase [Victivallales bacterium]|nr:acyl-CoA dehydratase activase [Victivallales bacterium]